MRKNKHFGQLRRYSSLSPDADIYALPGKREREETSECERDSHRLPEVSGNRHLVGDLRMTTVSHDIDNDIG